jgi:hypothetical protein
MDATARGGIELLEAAFGAGPAASPPAEAGTALAECQRAWIESLRSLLDDNELDCPRPGPDGLAGPTEELVSGYIFDLVALAERIRALRAGPGRGGAAGSACPAGPAA